MALVKSLPDPQAPGSILAYGKYTRFTVDALARTVTLTVAIYRSRDARDATDAGGGPMYTPVREESYFTTDEVTIGPDGPIAAAPTFSAYQDGDDADPSGIGAKVYGFLKQFTHWQGAEDA